MRQPGKISFWSVDEGDQDMEAAHGIVGATWMVYRVTEFFSPQAGEFRAEIAGTRWQDLWDAAEAVIEASGDYHHVFIEQFKPGPVAGEVWLMTGS